MTGGGGTFPAAEVGLATGAEPVAWGRVQSAGYGLVNAHWQVELADGRSAFVKHALTEDAVTWLRLERLVYESVRGTFMPEYLGSHDADDTTLLVIQDLTAADWPPPWSPERIDAVLSSLAVLRASPAPTGLPSLEGVRLRLGGWPAVVDDMGPLLGTGLSARGAGSSRRCRNSYAPS